MFQRSASLLQFHEAGCDNCPFLQMEGDRERVADCTTPNFQSLITVMEPNSSWAAKWLHVSKFLNSSTLSLHSLLNSLSQSRPQGQSGEDKGRDVGGGKVLGLHWKPVT